MCKKNTNTDSHTSARRDAWQVAALIAEAIRRSGSLRCQITESTLAELVGSQRLSRAMRRRICHEAQQLGFALYYFDHLMPNARTAVLSLASIQQDPVLEIGDIVAKLDASISSTT
jgi:hypothetical protein